MVFTSFNFLVFFPLLAIAYFATPRNYRWAVLLTGSYFFYININPVYAILLAVVTLSTWIFTRLIDNTSKESRKKRFMVINIALILLPLFFFKYFGVVNDGIFNLLERMNIRWPLPEISLLLPVGISFYTFMAIGYTIDVYNEALPAERNIGIVALFVSFFPLILSGPIERAGNMLPQFRASRDPDYAMIVSGLKLMLWGYFMKLVVADRVGIYVDAVYHNVGEHNGTSLLFTAVLYPFQVYADLGGYSLVAIGTAKVLGYHVMDNFRRPFFATSMAEFWRRWHISLISWLTDYVYTPLSFAFRKYRTAGVLIALLITFLISGIWHGASMTFVIWGLMQGVFVSIEAITAKRRAGFALRYQLRKKVWYIAGGCLVTFVLFASSQVFARSTSVDSALLVFSRIFSTSGPLFIGVPSILIFGLCGIALMMLKDFTDEFFPGKFLLFENRHKPVRVLAYSTVILLIFLIGVFDGGEFIYFQF